MNRDTVGRADAADYFAVNDKPMGVSTSYRVSGRRGELGKRFSLFADAKDDCKRLNKAYEVGLKDGALPDLIEAAKAVLEDIDDPFTISGVSEDRAEALRSALRKGGVE